MQTSMAPGSLDSCPRTHSSWLPGPAETRGAITSLNTLALLSTAPHRAAPHRTAPHPIRSAPCVVSLQSANRHSTLSTRSSCGATAVEADAGNATSLASVGPLSFPPNAPTLQASRPCGPVPRLSPDSCGAVCNVVVLFGHGQSPTKMLTLNLILVSQHKLLMLSLICCHQNRPVAANTQLTCGIATSKISRFSLSTGGRQTGCKRLRAAQSVLFASMPRINGLTLRVHSIGNRHGYNSIFNTALPIRVIVATSGSQQKKSLPAEPLQVLLK